MKIMDKFLRRAVIGAYIASPLVLADDTDIYIGANIDEASKPMVMLTLDLRPSLASNVCSDVTRDSCLEELGDALYAGLDLLTVNETGIVGKADGVPDSDQFPDSSNLKTAWSDYNSVVSLFDVLRAAFQVVLTEPVFLEGGIQLGMMLSHDYTCTGNPNSGPSMIPNQGQQGCSNGAYVLKGFFDPAELDANGEVVLGNDGNPIPSADLENFFARLAAIPLPTNSTYSHSYQMKEIYFEFYRYILGQEMYNGWLGYSDFGSDRNAPGGENFWLYNLSDDRNDVSQLLAPDEATYEFPNPSEKPKYIRYISPFENEGDWDCSALYMVNTVFGVSNQGDDSDGEMIKPAPLGMNFANRGITKPTDVDVVKTLYDTDLASDALGVSVEGEQFVKSYFIADKTNNTQDAWADAGGTGAALSLGDPQELIANLKDLLGGIISESSSLVSASVPANVYNRAETLDNLFLAIFQAEAGPRWPGNIKKLKIAAVPSYDQQNNVVAFRTEIQDVDGNPAFSPEDGRIEHTALTYWTDPAGSDVTPDVTDPTDPDYPLDEEEVVGKDGRSVERGGAGQQIPGYLPKETCSDAGPGTSNTDTCARKLFTESPASGGILIDFNHDDATADLLKSFLDQEGSEAVEAKEIIGWSRGLYDRTVDGARVSTQRWMMGDAIHSKPLAINFGDTDGDGGYDRENPNIHLFFGSNDGWLRSVRNTNSDGSQSGEEVWGFMPLEVMHKQQVLSKDSRTKREDFHPYGVDGRPVPLIIDLDSDGNIEVDDGDKVYIYFGLRRGGKAYYALDVTVPDAEPTMLWKITQSDPEFSQLGLTFSTPQVATVNYDGTPTSVLVFSGGYHGGWDSTGSLRIGKDLNGNEDSSGTSTGEPVGTSIYVVDAVSGDLLWKVENADFTGLISSASDSDAGVYGHADLDHSIPSDMVVVDADQNGIAERAYVGDTGGNVWRVDMPEFSGNSDSRNSWRLTKLATFGDNSGDGDRRFFHAPDIILARDSQNVGGAENPQYVTRSYIGVAIGAGDRAAPKDTINSNYLYYIKDPLITYDSAALDSWTPFNGVGSASDVAAGGLLDITDCPLGTESSCGFGSDASRLSNLENGWALQLEELGEKSLSTPITVQGTVYFTTYLPEGDDDAGVCAPNLGTGRLYAVSVSDGTPPFDLDSSVSGGAKADRSVDLDVPGIPPEPPFITPPPPPPCEGEGCTTPPPPPPGLVLPGGQIFDIGGRFLWKAYWREVGVDP